MKASRYLGSAVLMIAMTAAMGGCGTPAPPPNLSLDGPTRVTLGAVCLVGSAAPRQRVSVERCDAGEFDGEVTRIQENAYITNQLGNSVAVVEFSGSLPSLVDTRLDVPGVTHIPVGGGPSEIAVSSDGNFVFTYNQFDRDISVISADLRVEVARVPLDATVSRLFVGTDSQDPERESLWVLSANPAEISEVRWSFTCDGSDTYVEACQPELDVETHTAFALPEGSFPRDGAISPTKDSLFVTFGARASMVEVLMAAPGEDDPRVCEDGGDAPCIARQIGLTFGCLDGIDNDGDGLVDAADPQCLDPFSGESADGVRRAPDTACNDGIDNDGDGRVDAADDGCAFAADRSEGGGFRLPECEDGLDNDGDGATDADDPDCAEAAAGESTAPTDVAGLPACADGLDNDGDGSVDLDDPGCASGPDGDTELSAVGPCNDGIDNDGDGAVDYPADADCYGAGGSSEAAAPVFEFGPVAIDPEGRYAYVVDRRELQVIIIDLNTNAVLDPSNCGDGEDRCRPRPGDTRIGVPVGRVPQSLVARRLETTIDQSDAVRIDGGDSSFPRTTRVLRTTRTRAFANVATTSGSVFFVEAAQDIRVVEIEEEFDDSGSSQGEVENLLFEATNPILRRRDGESAPAISSTVSCDLNDEIFEFIDDVRGETVSRFQTRCDAPELPQVVPWCDPDVIPGCVCETGDDGAQSCIVTGLDPDDVTLRARGLTLTTLAEGEDADFCTEEGQDSVGCLCRASNGRTCTPGSDGCTCTKANIDFGAETDDFYIPADTWNVTYEGVVASRSDLIVDQALEGVVQVSGGDLCAAGVEDGDVLVLLSVVTPSSDGADCTAFEDRTLAYRVDSVSAGYIQLSVLADGAVLGFDGNDPELVQALPTRECFASGLRGEFRAVDRWVVRGDRTGVISNRVGASGVCVERSDALDQNSRADTGSPFSGPFFSFLIEPGEGDVEVPRDFNFSFTTSSRFRSTILEGGPTPTDIAVLDTRSGDFVFVLDAGTNIIRVYGARTGNALGLLF